MVISKKDLLELGFVQVRSKVKGVAAGWRHTQHGFEVPSEPALGELTQTYFRAGMDHGTHNLRVDFKRMMGIPLV